MRLALTALGALALMSRVALAEFPPPQSLPSQPALPDPLVMRDGAKVATPAQWKTDRRTELRELFEHYMYGRYPARPERVTGRVLFEDDKAFDGKATLREIEITFGPPQWPKIYLLVATPNGKTPAACFVGLNFAGNHQLLADERIRIPTTWMPARFPGVVDNRATAAGRGAQAETWPLEQIIDRGYAVATCYCGDVQPDRPDVSEGMRATPPKQGRANDGAETATIMWWAWGIHRAVDYLATDPSIDPKRIAAVGHSRLGKTALLAGAFDERIALSVANQAGCGGSAPSRTGGNPKAETVQKITSVNPHWFCKNFAVFASDTTRLPFDQHSLVALSAPRPVLFTAAAEDVWANPPGQFKVLQAASPVYELLGVDGLAAETMPEPDAPLIDSRLGYWIRAGQHAMTPADWKIYMDFADKHLR